MRSNDRSAAKVSNDQAWLLIGAITELCTTITGTR